MGLHSRGTSLALLTVVLASGIITGLSGWFIVGAQQDPDDQLPPPPPYNRWVRPDTGMFEAYVWDDRNVSPEVKASEPWYDPRWKPFSDCMVEHGYDVRSDSAMPFSQSDLDKVVAQSNEENPATAVNKEIGSDIDRVPGIAGAFLKCAGDWLALPRGEWPSHGITPIEPGELPSP